MLAYTAWVYRVLRGPVTAANIEADPHTNENLLQGSSTHVVLHLDFGLSFAAAFAALNAMWLELAPGKGLPE